MRRATSCHFPKFQLIRKSPGRSQEGIVKALLNRLLRKKVIRADKDGRRFLYSPVVSRETWLLTESKGSSWIDSLPAGSRRLPHLSRHGELTKRDIADLKRLIAEIEDED